MLRGTRCGLCSLLVVIAALALWACEPSAEERQAATRNLLLALQQGNAESVEQAIDDGAMIPKEALELATKAGNVAIIDALLDGGVDATGEEGSWALMWMAQEQQAEIVGRLIDAGADATGAGPLRGAILGGDEDIVDAMLHAGAVANINFIDVDGGTALSLAARKSPALVDKLLSAGADASVGNPLSGAIDGGSIDIVRVLLDGGAIPDEHDLQAAVLSSTPAAVVPMLLTAGADANANRGMTFLEAVITGDADLVRAFLAAGVDVNARVPVGGSVGLYREPAADGWAEHYHDEQPAIVIAAIEGYEDVVEALLDAGAWADAKDKTGWTALLRAVKKGKAEVAKVLILGGADCDAKTPVRGRSRRLGGKSAMMIAAGEERDNIVSLLAANCKTDERPLDESNSQPT